MVLFHLPRWVMGVLLVIGLAFVAVGIGMVATGAEGGWPGLLFFGLCSAVFAAQLWPGLLLTQTPEPPEALLRRFPGPVELHVPQRKTALIVVGIVIFAGVSIWQLRADHLNPLLSGVLWFCVAAMVLALPFLLFQLVRGASLRLEADGFRIKQPWRWTFVRWTDAGPFAVTGASVFGQIKGGWSTLVAFDNKQAENGNLSAVNRSIMGYNSALPDTYGLSAEALQTLLNGWRERALKP